MARVKLENVSKIYLNNITAVKNASFEVKDGEFMVLLGPSGCGKTTILRMIAGLENPTSGYIYIDDIIVNDIPPKDRDIAMVFQNYALYPHMTVYENMAFGLKLRKYPKSEIDKRVKEAARILGIEHLLDRKPKELSGGQRQRVAVGRAIVRNPKVFLFDEPLSNLDAKFRVQMRTEISKLHQKLGATMIYVTHDQVEAMTMGDRIVVIKDGVIQQIDTPLNLYNFPKNKFVAGFIGSPSMNFINGKIIQENGLKFIENNNGFKLSIPPEFYDKLKNYIDKPITLGIRPEHIYDPLYTQMLNGEKIKVFVDVVEPMGNEIYLYFTTPTAQCVARIPALEEPQVGTYKELIIDMKKIHLFDNETEKSILY